MKTNNKGFDKMTNEDVRQMIIDKFEDCRRIAKEHGYDLKPITVYFNITGTCAGMYQRTPGQGSFFKVNLTLAKANLEDYLRRTVPHEFAHYIVDMDYCNGTRWNKPKPHGDEWKRIMNNVFRSDSDRCHSYDITEVNKQRYGKLFVYKCNCREHTLTPIRHRKMVSNPSTYQCKICKSSLTFNQTK